jgi:sugar phosphate isomerase/epimerase
MIMELQIYKTLWGHTGDLDEAIAACHQHDFTGLEGQVPGSPAERKKFRNQLAQAGLGFIAEICTAGSYVPRRQATLPEHVESLRQQAEVALECNPRFLTVIGGCDAWSVEQSVNFLGEAMAIADKLGVQTSFETHRSRSFFNPWITRDILRQLPALELTCDFSHWCVVCERLVGDEPDVLALCAERARHVHARVGYDQGPQVPHPAAPVHREALEAHERWWTQIWRSQSARGMTVSTLTPEFGPDGYLHSMPFTNVPVADLSQINHWMAGREKKLFSETIISMTGRPMADRETVSLAH